MHSCADLTSVSKGTKLALILDQHRVKILLFNSLFGFSIIVFLMLNGTVLTLKIKGFLKNEILKMKISNLAVVTLLFGRVNLSHLTLK